MKPWEQELLDSVTGHVNRTSEGMAEGTKAELTQKIFKLQRKTLRLFRNDKPKTPDMPPSETPPTMD